MTSVQVDQFWWNTWVTSFPSPMARTFLRVVQGQTLPANPVGMTLTFYGPSFLIYPGDSSLYIPNFPTVVQYHTSLVSSDDGKTYDFLGFDSNAFNYAGAQKSLTTGMGGVDAAHNTIILSDPPQAQQGDSFTVYSYDNNATSFASEYSIFPVGTKSIVQLVSKTTSTQTYAPAPNGLYWVLPSLQQSLIGKTIQLAGQTSAGALSGSANILGIWTNNADNPNGIFTSPFTVVALDQDILSASTGSGLTTVTNGTLTLSTPPSPGPSPSPSPLTRSNKWIIIGGAIGIAILILLIILIIVLRHRSAAS